MKRIIAIVTICAIMISSVALALDLSSFSDAELMELPYLISNEMATRGLVKSAHIGSGKYIVGKDIPSGSYTIQNEYKYSMNIHVYSTAGKTLYNLALWSTGEETGKIDLENGDTLDINGNILLKVYSGITWNSSDSNDVFEAVSIPNPTDTPKPVVSAPTTKPTAKPATSAPTTKPTAKPTATSKPSDSGYNYTTEEFSALILKGIQGTLTREEAELLERYYQHFK